METIGRSSSEKSLTLSPSPTRRHCPETPTDHALRSRPPDISLPQNQTGASEGGKASPQPPPHTHTRTLENRTALAPTAKCSWPPLHHGGRPQAGPGGWSWGGSGADTLSRVPLSLDPSLSLSLSLSHCLFTALPYLGCRSVSLSARSGLLSLRAALSLRPQNPPSRWLFGEGQQGKSTRGPRRKWPAAASRKFGQNWGGIVEFSGEKFWGNFAKYTFFSACFLRVLPCHEPP